MDLGVLSKSTVATARMCPWRAYAHKVLHLPSVANIYAKNGQDAHALWGEVLSGKLSLEDAMIKASNDEVAHLTKLAVMNEPLTSVLGQQFEVYTEVDADHVWLTRSGKGLVCGFTDKEGIDASDDWWFVQDLKTGRWEHDDPFERDLYVYLSYRRHGARPIKFIRYFCRSGNAQVYHYSTDDITGRVTDTVFSTIEEVKAMSPDPNPGEHCENWFGSPCQFLGNQCPAATDVPSLVGSNLPADKASLGQGFLMVLNGDVDPESASRAYSACQQLQGAIDTVLGRVKDFARESPIRVGDQLLGWNPRHSYSVDKTFVLETLMDAGVPASDIARAVSISKSSLMHLPRYLGKTKDTLLNLPVTSEVSGETWGRIKED
jgi:hypothetical protein